MDIYLQSENSCKNNFFSHFMISLKHAYEIPNIASVICSLVPNKMFNYMISSRLLTEQRHNKEDNVRHNIKPKAIDDSIYALRGTLALAVTV